MELKIISVNFSYSVALKSIGVSCTLNDLLPMRDSVTCCTNHLENIGSLSYVDPPHVLVSSPISLGKS